MKAWAITSNGVGELVSYRVINNSWSLEAGEAFKVQDDPAGKVLADDGVSLRNQVEADRLPDLKTERKAYINEKRDSAMLAPVTYDGDGYDVSPQIRSDLTAAISFLAIGSDAGLPGIPTTVSWRDANNVDHDLTSGELLALAAAMFTSVQTAHVTARTLKDSIDSATTEAAVNAIDWP